MFWKFPNQKAKKAKLAYLWLTQTFFNHFFFIVKVHVGSLISSLAIIYLLKHIVLFTSKQFLKSHNFGQHFHKLHSVIYASRL